MARGTKPWFFRSIATAVRYLFTEDTRERAENLIEDGTYDRFRARSEADSEDESRGIAALATAFYVRIRAYVPIVLVSVTLAVSSYVCLGRGRLGALGTFYSGFGAVAVTRGVLRTPQEIDREAGLQAPVDGPKDDTERLVVALETTDAVLGILFVIVGQVVGGLGKTGPIDPILGLVGVPIVWLAVK